MSSRGGIPVQRICSPQLHGRLKSVGIVEAADGHADEVRCAVGVLAAREAGAAVGAEAARSSSRRSPRRSRKPDLANLLLDPYFNKTVKKAQENWRKVVALAAECGVPAPTFSSALAYYDSYRSARLPANLLQGQRDYFGAHTYERTDKPRGQFYHIDWPEATRPQIEIK